MTNVQCTSPRDEPTDASIAPAIPVAMSALVHDRYGGAEVLEHRSIPVPSVGAKQVLVHVEAASINPLDWHFMTGTPYLVRIVAGLRRPKQIVRGADVAGTVVAVGDEVTELAVGDRVFGGGVGSFAEYSLARPSSLASIPSSMSAPEAAAVPVAAITALQALRDKGEVERGHKVLVIGASGGVGTFAVQIAKGYGCEVTAVCSGRNVELVRSLGADHVIDYTVDESLGDSGPFDIIVDNIGNRTLSDIKRALVAGGRYVIVGGPKKGKWLGPMLFPIRAKLRFLLASQQARSFTASLTTADLETVAAMVEEGAVRSVIDRTYPLAEAADAMRYLITGRIRGKVIVDPNDAVQS